MRQHRAPAGAIVRRLLGAALTLNKPHRSATRRIAPFDPPQLRLKPNLGWTFKAPRALLDQYGPTVASCSVGGADLGEWLVRNGLALDWPQYSRGRYDAAQRDAERAGRGMWAGSYVEPWLYRACIRASGRPADCSDDANAHP